MSRQTTEFFLDGPIEFTVLKVMSSASSEFYEGCSAAHRVVLIGSWKGIPRSGILSHSQPAQFFSPSFYFTYDKFLGIPHG